MTTETMRLYLAGPMSGKPQYNIPTFFRVAEILRQKGYKVVNPAELDDAAVLRAGLASLDGGPLHDLPSWGCMLSRDVRYVADSVDGVVLLPMWYYSRGALLEAVVATLCDHQLFVWEEYSQDIARIPYKCVSDALKNRYT